MPRLLAAFAGAICLAIAVPSQEPSVPPAPADAPPAKEAAKSKPSAKVAEILARVETERQIVEAALQQRRVELATALQGKIDKETDSARKERLDDELIALEKLDVLPTLAKEEAKIYSDGRRNCLVQLQKVLGSALTKLTSEGDEAAERKLAEDLDAARERFEAALWNDLRHRPGFEDAVTRAGLVWSDAALVQPKGKDLRFSAPPLFQGENRSNHYRLRIGIERTSGAGPMRIVFPVAGTRPDLGVLVLDGDGGGSGWVVNVKGNRVAKYDGGKRLGEGEVTTIEIDCSLRRLGVSIDGTEVIGYDDMLKLALSKATAEELGIQGSGSGLLFLAPNTTNFRIVSLGLREVDDQAKAKPLESKFVGGVLPTDVMPLGRVWTGSLKMDSKAPTTLKVIARNQRMRTATLDLRAKGGWHVTMRVRSTNASGSAFEIVDVVRHDDKVQLVDETGGGKIGTQLDMNWSWRRLKGDTTKQWKNGFTGQP